MSTQSPKVSIIMSSYNHAQYVTQAIESAVHQSYKNIELIVVDDGSTDNSPQILQELQKKYGFYLECRHNHGLIPTLNYILQNLVSGKYICGIASDDFWSKNRVDKIVKLMEKNPECGLGHSDVFLIDENNIVLNQTDLPRNKKSGYIFEDLLTGQISVEAATMIVPFKVYQEIGFYDENLLIDDYQMWLSISSKYPVCYLPEKLVYYRKHPFNMSGNDLKMLLAEERIMESWVGNQNFERIKQLVYLNFFARFSKFSKKKALYYLSKIIKQKNTYKQKDFYKGLRRLLFYWK